jgi:hypothetical protein
MIKKTKMKSLIRRKPYLVPLFILLGVAGVAFFGWVVMSLWNAVLVPAAGAHIISFWQALGLLVLSRILVGGFGGGKKHAHKRGNWPSREKWMNMSQEEKETFKDEIKKRWSGRCDDPGYVNTESGQ